MNNFDNYLYNIIHSVAEKRYVEKYTVVIEDGNHLITLKINEKNPRLETILGLLKEGKFHNISCVSKVRHRIYNRATNEIYILLTNEVKNVYNNIYTCYKHNEYHGSSILTKGTFHRIITRNLLDLDMEKRFARIYPLDGREIGFDIDNCTIPQLEDGIEHLFKSSLVRIENINVYKTSRNNWHVIVRSANTFDMYIAFVQIINHYNGYRSLSSKSPEMRFIRLLDLNHLRFAQAQGYFVLSVGHDLFGTYNFKDNKLKSTYNEQQNVCNKNFNKGINL